MFGRDRKAAESQGERHRFFEEDRIRPAGHRDAEPFDDLVERARRPCRVGRDDRVARRSIGAIDVARPDELQQRGDHEV